MHASGKIFLIGFMGTGKTHWGKLWAEETGYTFFDLDTVIEELAGKTVAEIFDQDGEPFFREKEKELLRAFADKKNCIIACGGGTPCLNDNMQWMNENGTTVYLAASPHFIYGHVINEQDKRPLLKKINAAELLFFIEQKLKEREPFYTTSHIRLNVEQLDEKSIFSVIDHQ